MGQKENQEWYRVSAEAVCESLGVTPQGLSSTEAAERLQRFGPNHLPRKPPTSLFIIFLRQYFRAIYKKPVVFIDNILWVALQMKFPLIEQEGFVAILSDKG